MIFRKTALLASSLLLSSILTLPGLASPQNLQAYSDDTAALASAKMDLGRWLKHAGRLMPQSAKTTATAQSEGHNKTHLMEGLDEVNQLVREELGIDLFWDVLANLGEQVSIAYRPWPGRSGDVLFNLDLRSGYRAEKTLNQLYESQNPENNLEFLREKYGPYTLFTLVLDDNSDETYSRLQLAVAGNHLMASLGPDATQLKNMLYVSSVLPADSRFKLVNQSYFKPVEKHLQDSSGWLYADGQALFKLLETFFSNELGNEISTGDLALLKALVPLYRGLGLSFDLEDHGLRFKSYVAYEQEQLSPVQQNYVNALATRPRTLTQLLHNIPSSLAMLGAGEHLDLSFSTPLPVEPEILEASELASDMDFSVINDAISEFLNVDPTQDLAPYLDGRYGLAVFEAENSPQTVLYLGLKPGQEAGFEQNLMRKFKVGGLEGLFGMLAGELEELENAQESLEKESIRFEAGEIYQGIQFYELKGLPDLEEMAQWVAPVAARQGAFWMLAQSPLALKTALSTPAHPPAQLHQLMRQNNAQQAISHFFLDITRIMELVKKMTGDDEDVAEFADLLSAWKNLYVSSDATPEGLSGQVFVGLDFQAIDWNHPMLKEIFGAFNAEFEAQDFDYDTDYDEEDSDYSDDYGDADEALDSDDDSDDDALFEE